MFTNPNNYVYFGNSDGQSIALKRLNESTVELRLKLREDRHRIYFRYSGILGTPHISAEEEGLFDPRTRTWYELASQISAHIWTSVYIDFSSHDLVVTRARRVLAPDGELRGVVATDVSLREVNRFIATLDVGQRGRAFVVERDGNLIAANSMDILRSAPDGTASRISVNDSQDPVISAAYGAISHLLTSTADSALLDEARSEYLFTVNDAAGEPITVSANRIVDSAGLDWLAVVAMPQEEIFAGIRAQLWLAMAVALLALLLAILLGMRIFGRIANDVIALSRAVEKMRDGDTNAAIKIQRSDEVGELARNFQELNTKLFTDSLTGVANRAAFDASLGRLTHKNMRQPFLLLFIDLNDFKPLNDTYGHDNGDRALTKVAQRLKSVLRANDLLARLGGDEFVVIAPGEFNAATIQKLKDKLNTSIAQDLTSLIDIPAGKTVRLGAAIGHATWPGSAQNAEELLRAADASMYQEKSHKRR